MKLHLKVKQQEKVIEAYELMISDLLRYINLPKYRENPIEGVNPDDIMLRIREGQQYINTLSD
tara:strand:- start:244 stop:432 length:189 start_codon:yes stop_codon:yes gene_type:complete